MQSSKNNILCDCFCALASLWFFFLCVLSYEKAVEWAEGFTARIVDTLAFGSGKPDRNHGPSIHGSVSHHTASFFDRPRGLSCCTLWSRSVDYSATGRTSYRSL